MQKSVIGVRKGDSRSLDYSARVGNSRGTVTAIS